MGASFAGNVKNDEVLKRLLRNLVDKECIAWVGAGASAGLYPLWGQLLERMAEEAVELGRADHAELDNWRQLAATEPQGVAKIIRARLGEGYYRDILRRIFSPPSGSGHRSFTVVHEHMLRLPFRGYVTTNYDPGLVEARYALAHRSKDTGWATWKNENVLMQWRRDQVFSDDERPILFAHGYYAQPDTVVLDLDDYRNAYGRPLRRLLEDIYLRKSVVFVGIGFTDPWFSRIADDVLTDVYSAGSTSDHIAIVGHDGDTSFAAKKEIYRTKYGIHVLAYPVRHRPDGSPDHAALVELLDVIGGAPTLDVLADKEEPPPAARLDVSAVPADFVHETTEDEYFVERTALLDRLDRWAADDSVQLISLTGLGGTGKTSLMAYWLNERADKARQFDGMFLWSFYSDISVDSFLDRFVAFGARLGVSPRPGKPFESAITMLRERRLLVFLDGLEVLQERPGSNDYGGFLSTALSGFVNFACRERTGDSRQVRDPHPGTLILLTSRFPFSNLERYLGNTARDYQLSRVTRDEGIEILDQLAVVATPDELAGVVAAVAGHPLALRVYAAAFHGAAGEHRDRLDALAGLIWGEGADDLHAKLSRLLEFYRNAIPDSLATILGAVSVFRAPVNAATIGLVTDHLSKSGDISVNETIDGLRTLVRSGLASAEARDEQELFAAHPLVRDHFRIRLVDRDPVGAGTVARAMADRPETVIDIEEATLFVDLIRLMVDAGSHREGFALYEGRFDAGEILKRLPAPKLALDASLAFVGSEDRLARSVDALSDRDIGFMLNEAGRAASLVGDSELADHFMAASLDHERRLSDFENLAVSLTNSAEVKLRYGRLAEAHEFIAEGLKIAEGQPRRESILLALRGWVGFLSGDDLVAAKDFKRANDIERHLSQRDLYSGPGIQRAWVNLWTGRRRVAGKEAQVIWELSRQQGWGGDKARCETVLGLVAAWEGDIQRARGLLDDAEQTFQAGGLQVELPRLHLARAVVEFQGLDVDESKRQAEDAKNLAGARGWRVDFVDALLMLGALRAHAESEVGVLSPGRHRLGGQRWRNAKPVALSQGAMDLLEPARVTAAEIGYRRAVRLADASADELMAALGLLPSDGQ